MRDPKRLIVSFSVLMSLLPSPGWAETGNPSLPSAPTMTDPPRVKNDPAYQDAIRTTTPLTPDEVIEYRRYLDLKQKGMFDKSPPAFNQPQDVIHLRPGALPPLVRLAAGYTGAIYFTDMSGASWPVTEAKISEGSFQLEHPKTKSSNSLLITSQRNYRSADLIVFLKGLNFPLAIRIMADPHNADMKTHIIVPRLGPNPNLPDISGQQSMANGIVSATEERFLAGIPPRIATSIETSSPEISVWSYNGKYYIRTQYILTSPAYISLTKGDGDINLYEISPTPVVILSVAGKEKMISLDDSSVGYLH